MLFSVCKSGKWICTISLEDVICPKNQLWIENVTTCQESCESLTKPEKCIQFDSEYESCRCPSGLVLSPNVCIKAFLYIS